MSDTDFESIKLRARYEHFKSTPEERKTYVTLGLFALRGDMVFIAYYDEYAEQAVSVREVSDFYTLVGIDAADKVPRFVLCETDVITVEERDTRWEEVDDYINSKLSRLSTAS